jgi:GntR family transcriptional regulator, transcriptional repressor for pyruvate dehydrogenase complex
VNTSKGRKSIVERIITDLLERIGRDEYPIGSKIPTEPELAETLEASRSSVREAIRVLEILNVVKVQHGKGTYVESICPSFLVEPAKFGYKADANNLMSLLELRLIIEPESAALAAERATFDEMRALQAEVDALTRGVSEHRRPPEDMEFHLHIARATHNQPIIDVSRWIVAFYELDPEIPDATDIDDHRTICNAICNRDASDAQLFMRKHLKRIRNRLLSIHID